MKWLKKKSKKPHELVRCGESGGTGMVETYYPNKEFLVVGKMDGGSSAKEPCPNCGGSGWVEK